MTQAEYEAEVCFRLCKSIFATLLAQSIITQEDCQHLIKVAAEKYRAPIGELKVNSVAAEKGYRGRVSDSPPAGAAKRRKSCNISRRPPEFLREIICRIDKRGLEAVISTTSRPLSEGRKTGCGVNFSIEKFPRNEKAPTVFHRSGL